MCIVAGVDHLYAMKSLLIDLNVLHSAAPFTLVRGALGRAAAVGNLVPHWAGA